MRVGSGGVMLPHYSPYKVAENFRVLEALYPNRIDLGVGRAPGGMPIATRALQEGKMVSLDQYPEQIADVAMYLHDQVPENHHYANLKATPVIPTSPDMWLLGSSGECKDCRTTRCFLCIRTVHKRIRWTRGNGGL